MFVWRVLLGRLLLGLVGDVVTGSLPQHVELAAVLQAEVIKHHRTHHQLRTPGLRQVLSCRHFVVTCCCY